MHKKTLNKVVATAAFFSIASGVASFAVLSQNTTPQSTVTTTPVSTVVSTKVSTEIIASSYKNGTYEAVGSYSSPGGAEHIDVKLTIENNNITAAEIIPRASLPVSKKFQDLFTANFKQYVVGKNLNEVQIDKISGSSLTPKGFNDALAKIKAHAKA